MRPAGFEGNAQWHALAQQVLLADHIAQGLGPQALGQRLVGEAAMAAGVFAIRGL